MKNIFAEDKKKKRREMVDFIIIPVSKARVWTFYSIQRSKKN
jgi:hypothetical protein